MYKLPVNFKYKVSRNKVNILENVFNMKIKLIFKKLNKNFIEIEI